MASHLMILNEFINLFTTESVVADHPDLISTTTDRSFPKCNQVLAYGTIRDEKLAEAFWHVWNELNESCPATRTFCAFFYLLGSLFVLWVAFQNLLFVILLG
ncbi:MAG: hypothetical protein JWN70_5124 [Planctomycetaceae bacterium]|nr:hypothetical protein [Planctomycetaceae bacterium]